MARNNRTQDTIASVAEVAATHVEPATESTPAVESAPEPSIVARVDSEPVQSPARLSQKRLTATIAVVHVTIPVGQGHTVKATCFATLRGPGSTPVRVRNGQTEEVPLTDIDRSVECAGQYVEYSPALKAEIEHAAVVALTSWPGIADATQNAYKRFLSGVPAPTGPKVAPKGITF